MLNQTIVVGRLVDKPIVEENENGKKISVITLAVPRRFRNEEGVYDTDFIKCTLWNGVAENTALYCDKGDMLGVKGRLACLTGNLQLVAEKVTFLTSKPKKQESGE